MCDERVTTSRGEEPEELGEEICLPGIGQDNSRLVGVTRAYVGYLYLDNRYPYGRHRLQYIQFHLEWKGMECTLRIKGASE